MANVNVNLSLGRNAFSKSKNFNQVFENTQEVDNTDGFINLLSVSGTKGTAIVPSIKAFCVYNMGDVPAEVQFTFQEWKNNSNVDDDLTTSKSTSVVLPESLQIKIDFTTSVVGGTGGEAPGSAVGTVSIVVRSVVVRSAIALLNVLAKEECLRFCFFF